MISRWIVEAMQEAERVMEAVEGFGTGSATLDASLAAARKKLTDALAREGIHGMTHEHRWLDRGGVNVCWCGATDPPYRVSSYRPSLFQDSTQGQSVAIEKATSQPCLTADGMLTGQRPVWSGAADARVGLGREGMVTVWDDQGRYLGCMGVEAWGRLLKETPCGKGKA